MLFSLRRLKKLANLEAFSDQKVIDSLINLGFEVDQITKLNEISGIKFGQILEIRKNPEADNLWICKVQFADKIREIQTTAKNVIENKQVLAFIPGSKSGNNTFLAKKLRGHISEGMLISAVELGFNKHLLNSELDQGVLVFDPIFDLESNPLKVLELDDLILDIKLLWNRPDGNSYLVLANELAAFFKTDFSLINKEISGKFYSELKIINKTDSKIFALEIQKLPKLALVDIFLLLKSQVKIGNLAQNFANFILIYTGQPSYCLQLEKNQQKVELIEQKVKIKYEPDTISSYHFLNQEKKPLLIPEFSDQIIMENNSFFLIMPKFNLLKVKQIKQFLKKNSLKLTQLGKNYNYGTTFIALSFLNFFLEDQKIDFSWPINFDKSLFSKKTFLDLNYNELKEILGLELSQEDISKTNLILEKIGYNFDNTSFSPPFYRVDIEFFADYAADFLRFYGLEKLKDCKLEQVKAKIPNPDFEPVKLKTLGYYETNSFLLISKEENFNPLELKSQDLLTFPSQEHTKIRYSLAWQLAKITKYNQKRKITEINLYEKGSIAGWNHSLALASTIYTSEDLKKHLKILYNYDFDFLPADSEFLNPEKSQFIYLDNVLVGWLGQVAEKYNYENVNFLEILLSKVEKIPKKEGGKIKFRPYDNSQLKYRDITLSLLMKDIPDPYLKVIQKIPEIFSVKLINYVIINNQQKITYRITGPDQVCAEIDKFYK